MFHFGNLGEYFWQPNLLFWLSNIANYLFIELFLIVLIFFKKIKKKHFLFWSLYFFTPFLFNYLLFDPGYFRDQGHYILLLNKLKTGLNLDFNLSSFEGIKQSRTVVAALFYSIVPMFSLVTLTSIAFINKFYVIILYFFLKPKLSSPIIYSIFIIPSFILYNSISLRDFLIAFLMTLSLITLVDKRHILSLLFLIAVFLIKFQNAIGIAISWILVVVFRALKHKWNIIIPCVLGVVALLVLHTKIIPILNFWRFAFMIEDGNLLESSQLLAENVSLSHFIFYISKKLLIYPFSPFPWQTNAFGIVLFFESLALFFVYVYVFLKRVDLPGSLKRLQWVILISCLVNAGLYAYTISNYGTLSRYRFVAFIPHLIASIYIQYGKSHYEKG